jgi:general secretion pathway protein L
MTDVLILQPPASATDDQSLRWSVVRTGAVIAEGILAPGATVATPAGTVIERAVVVLPSEDVFIRRLPVPGQSERDARRAAPFLIEDQIAQPLEDVEVSLGPVGSDGARWLAALDRSLLKSWRDRLSGLDVSQLHIVPDGMVLTGHGGDLTVMGYGERVVFQTRAGDLGAGDEDAARDLDAALADPVCGAVEPHLLTPVLAGLGRRLSPKRVLISPELNPAALAPDDTPIAIKRIEAPDLRLAAAALPVEALNALPAIFGDAFAAKLDWGDMLRPWRWAAGLGLVAVLGASALMMGQAAYLDDRASRYQAAQEAEFRQLFPEARIVNVSAQMRQALNGVSGGGAGGAGFLPLASMLAGVLEDVDGVRVDSLRYDASRGELSVTALYSGFGDFERLRQGAEARGAVLEDGGARQSAAGVAGEFTVRLP